MLIRPEELPNQWRVTLSWVIPKILNVDPENRDDKVNAAQILYFGIDDLIFQVDRCLLRRYNAAILAGGAGILHRVIAHAIDAVGVDNDESPKYKFDIFEDLDGTWFWQRRFKGDEAMFQPPPGMEPDSFPEDLPESWETGYDDTGLLPKQEKSKVVNLDGFVEVDDPFPEGNEPC